MQTNIRELWSNYRSEVVFGVVLAIIVGASTYLSRFIPDSVFDIYITPVLNVCTSSVAFASAWVIFRHSEGMRMRRLWGYALLTWGIGDLVYLICYLVAPLQMMNMGAEQLTTHELLIGNLLGWVMILYPTETLRPGWLTPKVIAWQLIPMVALVALDYVVPFSLRLLIALYPYALLAMVLTHIRKYRQWCEDNFSTLDNMDVQWIIRYCIMLVIIGLNYVYICIGNEHTRGFTQQWFVIYMIVYSTEQILFRKNPWEDVTVKGDRLSVMGDGESVCQSEGRSVSDNGLTSNSDNGLLLQQWMEQQKPYLNPEFKLMDVRSVLPLNRTYLSQFINDTYGCSFYQFVNRYRIEEAKRMMQEHPEMKISEIAAHSGFSSQSSFSRAFSRETGLSPSEWSKNL